MAFGFKAFSSVDANSLVLDDTFSTWVQSASGTMSMPFTGSLTASYPSFNALSGQSPAVFVKIPTTGVWGLTGGWASSTSSPTNIDLINISQFQTSGSSTGVMDYRVYRPATNELNPATVKSGYGLNVFDSSGKPTFASSVKPLILDKVATLNSGISSLDSITTSGWYGSEIDLGISSPWVYALASLIQSIYFLTPTPPQRRVNALVPAFYHTNGTCRARLWLNSQVVVAALPPYTSNAPAGDTFKREVFATAG